MCALYDYKLHYKMDGQVFATRFREYRLDELLQAVENPEANLFGSFYPSVVIPKIIAENLIWWAYRFSIFSRLFPA